MPEMSELSKNDTYFSSGKGKVFHPYFRSNPAKAESSSYITEHLFSTMGELGRQKLYQYFEKCQDKNMDVWQSLKRLKARQQFQTASNQACCELLEAMGQKLHVVYSDLFEILKSQLQVQIHSTLEHIIPELEEQLDPELLETKLLLIIQQAARALEIPQLRDPAMSLLLAYFRAIQKFLVRQGFFYVDYGTIENLSDSELSLEALLVEHLTTRSLSEVSAFSHKIPPDFLCASFDVVRSIVKQAKQDEAVAHYCCKQAPLAFRSLLWPFASEWLLINLMDLIPLALHYLRLELFVSETLNKQLVERNALSQLITAASSSRLAFNVFCACIETVFMLLIPKKIRDDVLDEESICCGRISAFCHDKVFQSNDYDSDTLFRLPSLRVKVLLELHKDNPKKAAELDPTATGFIKLLEALINKANAQKPSVIGSLTSSTPSQTFSQGATYNDIESILNALRVFTIRTLEDVSTISFLLLHPPYLLQLAELFIDIQFFRNETSFIASSQANQKSSEFILGLLMLALSFPVIHSKIQILRQRQKVLTVAADDATQSLTRVNFEDNKCFNNLLQKQQRVPTSEFSLNETQPTRKRGRSSLSSESEEELFSNIGSSKAKKFAGSSGKRATVMGSVNLHAVIQHYRVFLTPPTMSLSSTDSMPSLMTVSSFKMTSSSSVPPKSIHSNPLLRKIRQCLMQPKASTIRFIRILNKALTSPPSEPTSYENSQEEETIKVLVSKLEGLYRFSKSQIFDQANYKTDEKDVKDDFSTNDTLNSENILAVEETKFKTKKETFHVINQIVPPTDKQLTLAKTVEKQAYPSQKNRFALDEQLITLILHGLFRYSLFTPRLEIFGELLLQCLEQATSLKFIQEISLQLSVVFCLMASKESNKNTFSPRYLIQIFRRIILPEQDNLKQEFFPKNLSFMQQKHWDLLYRLFSASQLVQVMSQHKITLLGFYDKRQFEVGLNACYDFSKSCNECYDIIWKIFIKSFSSVLSNTLEFRTLKA